MSSWLWGRELQVTDRNAEASREESTEPVAGHVVHEAIASRNKKWINLPCRGLEHGIHAALPVALYGVKGQLPIQAGFGEGVYGYRAPKSAGDLLSHASVPTASFRDTHGL